MTETDSITIEIHDRCPTGLEIFRNETTFAVNLTASGGVGDFEVLNAENEVIALVQKHLSMLSLLENTSRSEVLTVDISDISEMLISCPATEEVAVMTNVRVGLFQPNTLEIVSRGRFADSRAMDFRWEPCDNSSSKPNNSSTPTSTAGQDVATPSKANSSADNGSSTHFNYKVVNHASVVVAEILLRRTGCRASVRLVEEQHLSPVQIAVIFGGLSFLVLAVKKQKSLVKLGSLVVFLILLVGIMVIISVVTS
ncbi:unnamed protein product [Orchesella dallaii]|uniref:Uncharacterized protein n=1 Tax=Orchesella dallaii TaxID=48710 RepID=A0ABP1PXF6_9HEXA